MCVLKINIKWTSRYSLGKVEETDRENLEIEQRQFLFERFIILKYCVGDVRIVERSL